MTFLLAVIIIIQFIKHQKMVKYVDQCVQKSNMMSSSVLLCQRTRFIQFTVRH